MGNCLKTQLKEAVQNDNLQKLGDLVILNPEGATGQITIGCVPGNIKSYDASGNEVKNVDFIDSYSGAITASETKIVLNSKYNINSFTIRFRTSYNVNDLIYASNLTTLNCASNIWLVNNELNVSIIHNWPSLSFYSTPNSANVKGNLSEFANHVNAANIDTISIPESSVSGTLSDLLPCTSLGTLNIKYCQNITVTRSALNALQAQGCTIQYTQTVIEDV